MTIQPGFQLYSVRGFPPLDQRLEELAELGYRSVETHDAQLDSAEQLAAALAAHRLTAPSGQVTLERLRADPERVWRQAATLGLELLVVPQLAQGQRPGDVTGWMRLGAELSSLAIKARNRGFKFAWHNRADELAPLEDGSRPIEHLLAADDDILWECDVGWLVRAGEDPTEWIERHPSRIVAAHLRDLDPNSSNGEDGWADIGHGMLDWGLIVPALEKAGTRHWIVAHDHPLDPWRFASRSIATIRGWE